MNDIIEKTNRCCVETITNYFIDYIGINVAYFEIPGPNLSKQS